MPEQRVSAKGRRRANSPRLALAGSNPGKGRESFVPALENKEETRKDTAREPGVAFSMRRELVEGIWCWVLP